MHSLFSRLAVYLFVIVTFTACFGPKTPQETAAAFWEAVGENDAGGAVRYSTLTDEKQFDGFGRSWEGITPAVERVVIEGNTAYIIAEIHPPGSAGNTPERVTTYLVQRNGKWLVDYRRTAEGIRGGAFAAFIGELGRLGQTLAEQFAGASNDLNREMETMRRQMDTLADSLDRRMTDSITRYGKTLSKRIDALAASAREALDETEHNLTDNEKRLLEEVADDMDAQSDRLSEPNADRIAEGTENALQAQQKLLSIDEKALAQYKQQWNAWLKAFEKEVQAFIDAFDAELEKGKASEPI